MVEPFIFSSAALSFCTILVHGSVAIVQIAVRHSTESMPPFSSTLPILKAGELGLPGLSVTKTYELLVSL